MVCDAPCSNEGLGAMLQVLYFDFFDQIGHSGGKELYVSVKQ